MTVDLRRGENSGRSTKWVFCWENVGFLDSQGNLIKSRNNKMTGSTESGKIKHVI